MHALEARRDRAGQLGGEAGFADATCANHRDNVTTLLQHGMTQQLQLVHAPDDSIIENIGSIARVLTAMRRSGPVW